MLYRFATTTAAVDWLAAEWSLERVAIGSVAEIPLDFLTRTPEWWTPGDGVVDAYYSASAELVPAGRRDLILVFDRDEEVLYAVEHYDRLTGP